MARQQLEGIHWIRSVDDKAESWCGIPGDQLAAFCYSADATTCLECLRKRLAVSEAEPRIPNVVRDPNTGIWHMPNPRYRVEEEEREAP